MTSRCCQQRLEKEHNHRGRKLNHLLMLPRLTVESVRTRRAANKLAKLVRARDIGPRPERHRLDIARLAEVNHGPRGRTVRVEAAPVRAARGDFLQGEELRATEIGQKLRATYLGDGDPVK